METALVTMGAALLAMVAATFVAVLGSIYELRREGTKTRDKLDENNQKLDENNEALRELAARTTILEASHQHLLRWRVVPDGRGLYTIAPPERIRYGPAHAPDPLPAHGPPPRTARHPAAGSIARAAPDRADPADGPSARAHQPKPLFTLA